MKPIYKKYVHEYINSVGEKRYAVAEFDESTGQYSRPLDKRTAELKGCLVEATDNLSDFGGYKTIKQALRRARYLFAGE
jgi:hypothetical protein